jgi:hypothetical protein
MSTEPQRTCPSCGNELSGEMEFCPICMLRKALADGVESGEPSSKDTVTLVPARGPRQRPERHRSAALPGNFSD